MVASVGRLVDRGLSEKRARELLAAGWGIKRVAKELGTGVSFVQRAKGTANRPS